jgi:hypothetical protein
MAAVFESYFQELKNELDVDDDTKELFNGLINKYYVPIQTITAPAISKVTKKTGYSIFLSTKNSELKEANPDWKLRQPLIVNMWKLLTPEEKLEWNAKASVMQPMGTVIPKGKRQMNGWNLFFKEHRLQDKTTSPKDIGGSWKSLSKDEQNVYNQRAKNGQTNVVPIVTVAPKLAITIKKTI